MEDIKKKKMYPIVDLSKFTSNKKILSGVVTLVYKTIINCFLPDFVQSLLMLDLKKFGMIVNSF